jgi:capsid portal protein
MEGEESGSHAKVEVKPLVKEQHKDALFQNYSENNQDKVRRVWRLPPIFVGRTDEYTRATAEASRVLADEQIFAPERQEFDELFNRTMFPEMGIIYHRYKSNSPNTTDNQQLVKILAGAEKTGGMTPRIARVMLEDILSAELPDFPSDFPSDVPFSLTMAEAVKNKAEASEPGQQVTALKRLWDIDDDVDEPTLIEAECTKCGHQEMVSGLGSDPMVDHLLSINKKLEKRLQSEVEAAREAEDTTDFDLDM